MAGRLEFRKKSLCDYKELAVGDPLLVKSCIYLPTISMHFLRLFWKAKDIELFSFLSFRSIDDLAFRQKAYVRAETCRQCLNRKGRLDYRRRRLASAIRGCERLRTVFEAGKTREAIFMAFADMVSFLFAVTHKRCPHLTLMSSPLAKKMKLLLTKKLANMLK